MVRFLDETFRDTYVTLFPPIYRYNYTVLTQKNPMGQLVFLKLGGSLITDKTRPYSPRTDQMLALAGQIAAVKRTDPGLKILLGHGSGSFGHTAALEYGTRSGVQTPAQWHGFSEVRFQAASLHHLLLGALRHAGLPAVSFPPSASATARDGRIRHWEIRPLMAALSAGLLPVVYGDVAFDTARGGTILSTEDLFEYLAGRLHPQAILLAGLEEGVWADFPGRGHLLEEITPADLPRIRKDMAAMEAADVTGAMAGKVEKMLALIRKTPELRIMIFSAEEAGALERALKGQRMGTIVRIPD